MCALKAHACWFLSYLPDFDNKRADRSPSNRNYPDELVNAKSSRFRENDLHCHARRCMLRSRNQFPLKTSTVNRQGFTGLKETSDSGEIIFVSAQLRIKTERWQKTRDNNVDVICRRGTTLFSRNLHSSSADSASQHYPIPTSTHLNYSTRLLTCCCCLCHLRPVL